MDAAAASRSPVAPRPRWPLLRLARPRQWPKNALVLAPLVFAGRWRDAASAAEALLAVAVFVAASALVYVLNDAVDEPHDRRHPAKRLSRPLAAGWVTRREAAGLWCALALLVAGALAARPVLAPAVAGFVALNAAYTLWLKRIPVLDLTALAGGYLLRLYAGAAAVHVPLSVWIVVTTFFLSVFLAAGKRAREQGASGDAGRAVLRRYPPGLLSHIEHGAAAGALACYAAYLAFAHPELLPTAIPVALGFARFRFLSRAGRLGECPTDVLLGDPPLLLAVLAWGVSCALLVRPG